MYLKPIPIVDWSQPTLPIFLKNLSLSNADVSQPKPVVGGSQQNRYRPLSYGKGPNLIKIIFTVSFVLFKLSHQNHLHRFICSLLSWLPPRIPKLGKWFSSGFNLRFKPCSVSSWTNSSHRYARWNSLCHGSFWNPTQLWYSIH